MRSLYTLLLVLATGAGVVPAPAQSPSASGNMVLVPDGEFWMGRANFFTGDEISSMTPEGMDDSPAHLVTLDAFYIDQYETTNEEYAAFVEMTGRPAPDYWVAGQHPGDRPRHPVHSVSWHDATDYCESVGKRLPTEAEWERAARGGRDRQLFPWGDFLVPPGGGESVRDLPDIRRGHFADPGGPLDVGGFPPNDYGLYDMIGNVWEWVSDRYEKFYYAVSPAENPEGGEGSDRVLRGGSWSDSDARTLAVNNRGHADPDTLSPTYGFRCAMSIDAEH